MNAPTGGTAAAPALADFIALNEEIAALVRARIPLESQLADFGRELPGRAGELARQVARRLEAGENLAEAIENECASLPVAYRAVIVAGAESGQLAAALESLVDSAARTEQLRRITGVALIYPAVLAVVACWLLALVFANVIPKFDWLGQYRFGPVVWLSSWRYTVPLLTFILPGLLVLLAAVWWWRSGRLNAAGAANSGWLGWLPGNRKIRRWSQTATFADLLLLMVDRGVPLDRALRLAAESTDDASLRTAALQLADQSHSGSAAGALRHSEEGSAGEIPLLIRLALHHAKDRALLAGGLRQAAAMYRERAVRAAQWYAEYLPILLTVLIGGAITIGFTTFIIWPYAATLYELSDWNWR
jgi:general secretion pathway protein F